MVVGPQKGHGEVAEIRHDDSAPSARLDRESFFIEEFEVHKVLAQAKTAVEIAMGSGAPVVVNWNPLRDYTRQDFVADMNKAGFGAREWNRIEDETRAIVARYVAQCKAANIDPAKALAEYEDGQHPADEMFGPYAPVTVEPA